MEKTLAPHDTVARCATNKHDDDIKITSSSKGEKFGVDTDPVENHSGAAAPRERNTTAGENFLLVRAAYEKATGNRRNKADSEAYHQNGIGKVPLDKIISLLEAVVRRTPTKINSVRYFVKEILALPGPQSALVPPF